LDKEKDIGDLPKRGTIKEHDLNLALTPEGKMRTLLFMLAVGL
jgi:hypothetical protein